MATLREIRNCIAEDLRVNGASMHDVLEFEDQFARNARFRQDSLLVTTDIEMSGMYVWVDEMPDGTYISCMRYGRSEKRRSF